jgi:hypothetical protein
LTLGILRNAARSSGASFLPGEKLAKPVLWQYRKLKMPTFIHTIAGTPRTGVFLERLEPCEGKLSRTVLRGAWAG